jgi:high-affinity Fe2+/Pb2+ permease
MVSSMGVILALSTATLLNITQGMLKPELKNKKWFFEFGGFNLLAAGFLFGYGVYHLSNLYMKVP